MRACSLFARHDAYRQNALDHDQLSRLLRTLNDNRAVPEAEVAYALHLADTRGRGAVKRQELDSAVVAWRALRDDMARIQERFSRYDTAGSGLLEKPQVEALLRDVNQGIAVSTAEVEWIMNRADADGNGAIDSEELNSAVALWYLHVTKQTEQKEEAEGRVGLFFCCSKRSRMELYEYPGSMTDNPVVRNAL